MILAADIEELYEYLSTYFFQLENLNLEYLNLTQ